MLKGGGGGTKFYLGRMPNVAAILTDAHISSSQSRTG